MTPEERKALEAEWALERASNRVYVLFQAFELSMRVIAYHDREMVRQHIRHAGADLSWPKGDMGPVVWASWPLRWQEAPAMCQWVSETTARMTKRYGADEAVKFVNVVRLESDINEVLRAHLNADTAP